MTDQDPIQERLEQLQGLMRVKLKVRGQSFADSFERSKKQMPRHVRNHALRLVDAMPLLDHPKLRQTVDHTALGHSAQEVETYLQAIDLADQRKGFFLGVLGSIAFNILIFVAMFVAFLWWKGMI